MEGKRNSVRLLIIAHDEQHAKRILEAAYGAKDNEEIHVTCDEDAPTGHTYRELLEAWRAGLLEGTKASPGILFTRTALEAFRARKSERRRQRKADPERDAARQAEADGRAQIAAIDRAIARSRRAR